MVRHVSGEHNQLGADVRSRSPSPTGMLGMQLEHGMLAVSAKRQQELTEQVCTTDPLALLRQVAQQHFGKVCERSRSKKGCKAQI